jgi:hypothetical protein
MRGMATLAAALLVGLGTAAAQERPGEKEPAPKPQSGGGSWLAWLWPFGRKAEEKKAPASETRPNAVESARVVRVRELAALHRRQAVCDRLREVAYRTGDQELLRQAEDLENMAWDTYAIRTAHLPASNAPPSPDEGTLARRLGSDGDQAGAALLSGGQEKDGGRLAERRDR